MRLLARHSGILVITLAMLAGVFVMHGPVLGWQVHTVVSGSMCPELQVGETVITRQVDPATIEPGDIITFRSPTDDRPICHRVVETKGDGPLYFRTKGDANSIPDLFLVSAERVTGSVRFHTSVLAHITSAVKSPLAFVLLCV